MRTGRICVILEGRAPTTPEMEVWCLVLVAHTLVKVPKHCQNKTVVHRTRLSSTTGHLRCKPWHPIQRWRQNKTHSGSFSINTSSIFSVSSSSPLHPLQRGRRRRSDTQRENRNYESGWCVDALSGGCNHRKDWCRDARFVRKKGDAPLLKTGSHLDSAFVF